MEEATVLRQTRVNAAVNNFVWGVPAMICIIGVGLLYFQLVQDLSRSENLRYAIKNSIGRIFTK